jgi:hypothetical protein
MPLVSSAIPNLINGVSQQPPALRLASQAEAVINCLPSPVEGLKKRPSMQHEALLFTGTALNSSKTNRPFVHMVDRDGTVKYMIIIYETNSGPAIKVCDLDGTTYTPSTPDGVTYLDVTGSPSEQIRVASIADFTFIVNREKKVIMDTALSPIWGTKSMVFIKAANYDTEYSVNLNGTTKVFKTMPAGGRETPASFTTSSTTVTVTANGHGLSTGDEVKMSFPAGNAAVAGKYTITVNSANQFQYTVALSSSASGNCTVVYNPTLSNVTIADELATLLNTISGFTVTNDDYIIRITKDDGGAYTLSSKDNRTGEDTKAIKEVVDDMSDLPTIAEHGFIVRVQGSKATQLDDYFVKFNTVAGSGFGDGTWKETVAPGIEYKFNATTMPHVLVRNVASNGTVTFEFKKHTWGERLAGDATTAPEPSFVDSYIQNINLFRNRLVLLADENVILSAAAAFERFWPETVQTVVDSDPVDLSTGGTSINFLVSAVAFANTLLLFSRHGQFRLDAGINVGSSLTPKTASITAMTTFDMADTVDPVAVGRNLYFPIPKGDNFSGVREFFLPDSSGSVPLSEDITASIPRYLPSNICSFIASVSEEALVLISKDQPKRIYLYKFFYEDDTKLQSAWSYWEVNVNDNAKRILGAGMVDSDLYAVVEYSDGVYLEHIVIRPENVDAGTEIEILLDRKTTESETGVSTTLINPGALGVQTTITLPYPIAAGAQMVVVGRYEAGNTILRHGQVIEPISQTSNSITVLGDLKTQVGGKTPRFFIGERYEMTYEFSTPYIKEEPPGGGVAIAAGPKLQMRTWTVLFDESSAFELKVTPASRDTNTYPYNGIVVGQSPPLIGDPSVLTGSFRVPVMASNIDTKIVISSTSPLPCRFQSAEWEGFYHTRAKRM